MPADISPIYSETRPLIEGEHRFRFSAWTRAYHLRTQTDGEVAILYAGVSCSVDTDDATDWFWDGAAELERRNVQPTVVRVRHRFAALRLAVQDSDTWLDWAWPRLMKFPRGLCKLPHVLWCPAGKVRELGELRAHLASLEERPKIERHAAVCLIERLEDEERGREMLVVWNRRYHGWTLPGGRVEAGETPWLAAARELKEETRMSVHGGHLLYEAPLVPSTKHEDRASVVHVFKTTATGTPQQGEPGCPVTWMTRDEFLRGCPFAEFYLRMFMDLEAKPIPQGGAA